jgi:hypothetical protein
MGGNNAGAIWVYEDNRLLLTRLLTQRTAASSFGAVTLQDLGYTRDQVGNITQITDSVQETVFFSNAQVSATRSFAYDSLYRLTSGTGREKVSQTQSTAFCSGYAGSQGTTPDKGLESHSSAVD